MNPLWFVWDGGSLWLNSRVRSQRWANLQRDPRVAVVVDVGEGYTDLRGVQIKGTARAAGDVPRTPARTRSSPTSNGASPKYADGRFGTREPGLAHEVRGPWGRS